MNEPLTKLDETTVSRDPVEQFGRWYKDACDAGVPEPNAMNLATVAANHRPSSRIMLLKDFDADGFSFFTNYESRKAKEIYQNPYACLSFFWPQLGRQIRVEGFLKLLSQEKSDAYFLSRPRASRIGAWASPQSREIGSRTELEEKIKNEEEKFSNREVTRPQWWGGFLLVPDRIEFWQAGDARLHDRICYTKVGDQWKTARLAP